MTFFSFWGIIKRGIYMISNKYLWKLQEKLVHNYFMINSYKNFHNLKIFLNLQQMHDEMLNLVVMKNLIINQLKYKA